MEVIPLQLDWTKKNYKIEKFLFSKERYGIPYNEFYSEKYRNGYLLPELLDKKVLINAINKIKNQEVKNDKNWRKNTKIYFKNKK